MRIDVATPLHQGLPTTLGITIPRHLIMGLPGETNGKTHRRTIRFASEINSAPPSRFRSPRLTPERSCSTKALQNGWLDEGQVPNLVNDDRRAESRRLHYPASSVAHGKYSYSVEEILPALYFRSGQVSPRFRRRDDPQPQMMKRRLRDGASQSSISCASAARRINSDSRAAEPGDGLGDRLAITGALCSPIRARPGRREDIWSFASFSPVVVTNGSRAGEMRDRLGAIGCIGKISLPRQTYFRWRAADAPGDARSMSPRRHILAAEDVAFADAALVQSRRRARRRRRQHGPD